jgi:hypothetical protein
MWYLYKHCKIVASLNPCVLFLSSMPIGNHQRHAGTCYPPGTECSRPWHEEYTVEHTARYYEQLKDDQWLGGSLDVHLGDHSDSHSSVLVRNTKCRWQQYICYYIIIYIYIYTSFNFIWIIMISSDLIGYDFLFISW